MCSYWRSRFGAPGSLRHGDLLSVAPCPRSIRRGRPPNARADACSEVEHEAQEAVLDERRGEPAGEVDGLGVEPDEVAAAGLTPSNWELNESGGVFAEQVIRPTGLIDPPVDIRPARTQVDDLVGEVRASPSKAIARWSPC